MNVVAVNSAGGGSARGVEVEAARAAAVEPRALSRAVAARRRSAAALGDHQREVMLRVPRAAHGRRQLHAARVHVEAAGRAAVEEAARGAAARADVAADLGELELVWVVSRREERPRVAGAGDVDGEVAAVGGAGQVLPAQVADERPHVVPLHQLVPWPLDGRSGQWCPSPSQISISLARSRWVVLDVGFAWVVYSCPLGWE
jgi:hypothetical protein